jgi:hypothetical protein
MKGTEREAWYWWERARAARTVADIAKTPEEKIAAFQSARDACEILGSRFPKSSWVALPWRSSPAPRDPQDQPVPSLTARLKTYCDAQIKWLQSVAGQGVTTTPDPDFSATLTLDIDGTEHTLKIKTYSAVAPYEVQNLVRLADYFAGTQLFGLQQDDPNTNVNHAVVLGSPLSKLVPDRKDVHGGPGDWVGFTLPSKASPLAIKRGSVGWAPRIENNVSVGLDPTRLVICLQDQAGFPNSLGVFGEIEGSEEALTALDGLLATVVVEGEDRNKKVLAAVETPNLRLLEPEKSVAVKSVTVEGSPAVTPEAPITEEIVMPEKPADLPAKEEGEVKKEEEK